MKTTPQHRNWISRVFLPAASAALALAAVLVLAVITTQPAQAQDFTLLSSFPGGTDGEIPDAGLVQGTDGSLYGTTSYGGCSAVSCGTVFKITPTGTLTTIFSFCTVSNCPQGEEPVAGLVLGTDGNFYGTTPYGGTARRRVRSADHEQPTPPDLR
jgi:uncharacterized repeat protein (TIGR03803 family)